MSKKLHELSANDVVLQPSDVPSSRLVPAATTADNGKVLTIAGGVPAWIEPGGSAGKMTILELATAVAGFNDIPTAKAALIGVEVKDTWTGTNFSGAGDASVYLPGVPDKDASNHPIWYDPWIVTDVKSVVDGDGVTHSVAAVLMRKYATQTKIVFDAANQETVAAGETGDASLFYYGLVAGKTAPASAADLTLFTLADGEAMPSGYAKIYKNAYRDDSKNIVLNGHARYGTSALRQWLNASGAKNTWWTKQYTGQVSPTSALYYDGYLAGCSQAILKFAKAVRHTCAEIDGTTTYEVCDRFFAPSVRELYGVWSDAEGSAQAEYWRALVGDVTLNPSNSRAELNSVRAVCHVNDKSTISAQGSDTRSFFSTTNPSYYYMVKPNGSLSASATKYAFATNPCCVIY